MGEKTKVLIADDHRLFADTLRVYLERTYEVVATVHDGRAMIDHALTLKPDVIVVDISMPSLNGLDGAKRIKEQIQNSRFVFLTMHEDPNLAAAALELRPIGFVLKQSAGSELMKAIDEVLSGQTYLPRKFRSMDCEEIRRRAKKFSKEMTPRRRDVLQLLAEGRSMKQVARELDLSQKTVEFHKQNIMQEFNLRSNSELVLFAVKQGLITIDM